MVQGPPEEAKRLAEKFPGFDVVVATSDFADPDERPETLNGGKTLLINVGQKGKYVGVVGLFPGPTPMLRYRRQPLDRRDFREAEPMRTLIDDEYQDDAQDGRAWSRTSPAAPTAQAPPGATYVGAEACQACHPKTFEKWATHQARPGLRRPDATPSGTASSTPSASVATPPASSYNSGWVSAEKTPYLKGNQCENCHGPASQHVAEPDNLGLPQADGPDRRDGRPATASASSATTRTTTPTSTSPPATPRSSTRGSTPTTTPRSTRPSPPKVADGEPSGESTGPDSPEKDFRDARSRRPPRPRSSTGSSPSTARTTRHPVNHFLHLGVGWPMCAAAVILLPFRPLWSLGLFLGGYALMFAGHFLFEGNTPTVLKHPSTPFVIAWAVIRGLGSGLARLATGSKAR